MKKLLLTLIVLISFMGIASGCQKSEQEKMDALRAEQDIDTISDAQLLEQVVSGKEAFMGIFQSVEVEEELVDEFGIVYSPFLEEYNSPEKIKDVLEEYYSKDYSEKLIELIPATYVDGEYALPLGDMGMLPDYSEIFIVERKDLDEKNINTSYKMQQDSSELYRVYFEYVDGKWKITDEIREYEKE